MKDKLIIALADALEMESAQINLDDSFRNYENYSSLTELSLLAMLDTSFKIEIEMEDFNKYRTVEDLVHLVTQQNNKILK